MRLDQNQRLIERATPAFTILEMLVAVAVFSAMMLVVFSVIGHASIVWRRSTDKIESFQGARLGFDIVTRNLSQATLNTYLDYDDPSTPTKYLRKSELKFLCQNAGANGVPGTPGTGQALFFQAPGNMTKNANYSGLESLLNTFGYYVEFGPDTSIKPSFVKSAAKYRYRLMQLLVPTENNTVYSRTGNAWFTGYDANVFPVADNIIAFIVRPQDPGASSPDLTSDYVYNSYASFNGEQPATSNQLPPVIQVTMITIDENAAARIENGSSQPSQISSALAGKFTNPSQYSSDLKALENALNASTPPIPYRVFSSTVPIRESKWTK